jgi:hypothetical protein
MLERPTTDELLDAVQAHLQEAVIPAIKGDRKLYFQTLVALNVLKIVQREMELQDDHLTTQWQRLNQLQGVDTPLPKEREEIESQLTERNRQLCGDIHSGYFDQKPRTKRLLAHLKATLVENLTIANPRFLQMLQAEDAQD